MHSKLIQKDDRKANLILLEIIQRLFGYELSKKEKRPYSIQNSLHPKIINRAIINRAVIIQKSKKLEISMTPSFVWYTLRGSNPGHPVGFQLNYIGLS